MNAHAAQPSAVPGISAETRLSQVLDAVPGALDYIVSLNAHDFGRLRNPVLRRYMSSRISLRRVAAMVKRARAAGGGRPDPAGAW